MERKHSDSEWPIRRSASGSQTRIPYNYSESTLGNADALPDSAPDIPNLSHPAFGNRTFFESSTPQNRTDKSLRIDAAIIEKDNAKHALAAISVEKDTAVPTHDAATSKKGVAVTAGDTSAAERDAMFAAMAQHEGPHRALLDMACEGLARDVPDVHCARRRMWWRRTLRWRKRSARWRWWRRRPLRPVSSL